MANQANRHTLEHRFKLHMQDRALEWFSAMIMLSWGAVLAMPGDTLAGANFDAFRRYRMTGPGPSAPLAAHA
ncbi:hypothetical protein PY365_21630 [Roseiarcaceae bacterium H3SJ34-1]|uniref:hypothetical protein n=1 Tax=Terripilifer ovatus TaxID=3032367 RepID=UPI003AB99951|nr:hypothetical protein [Roseiarcaceae bacterium H3SJ34-1]